jgi:hypothetical protein
VDTKANQLANLKCQSLLVCFGSHEGATSWLSETGIKLGMITDEARVLYKFFNLKSSYYAVWKSATLVYYAEQRTAKRILPKSEEKDDPHQLGGDFLLEAQLNSAEFKILLSHASKTPPDRVKPTDLINFLKTC